MATSAASTGSLQEVARRVGHVLGEQATQVDQSATFPGGGMRALRNAGLLGVLVPREYGGCGAGYKTFVRVARELAGGCLSTAMIWGMHCQQVSVIADHAPEPLRARVLRAIAEGAICVASVTSEGRKGGDILTAVSALIHNGGDVNFTRDASVVTGGEYADAYLMTMRQFPESPPSDVVLVYADRDQVETLPTNAWTAMGMRGTQSVGMVLRGRVPAIQIINPPGGFGMVATATMVPVGHIAWAACWLGAAEGCYRQLLQILRDPVARGGLNVKSDLFAQRLAQVRLEIDTVEVYLDRVVSEYESRRRRRKGLSAWDDPGFNIRINNLKILASERLFRAVDEMVQIGGLRYGYVANGAVALERTFRDLRSAQLMYSNERLWVTNGKLAFIEK